MILDPINSVASIDFYKKISGQSLGRSFLYVCYIAALFSIIGTFALKIKIGPVIDETFQWLERAMPPLTYQDGKVTSTLTAPLKLQHPRLPEVSLMIDTSRVDAVTPRQMEEAKALAFLTSSAFYLRQQNGKLEVYDLSKSPTGAKPIQIDSAFFQNADLIMSRVLYPVALAIFFALFLAWKGFASIAYSLVALLINALANGGLGYAPLLTIAIYAQTLAVGFQAVSLFLPFGIPGFSLICLLITSFYIWLAVKRHSPSPSPSV